MNPPKHLTGRARELWAEVMAAGPPGGFEVGVQPLLASYCWTAAHAEHLAEQLAKARKAQDFDRVRDFAQRLALMNASLADLERALQISR